MVRKAFFTILSLLLYNCIFASTYNSRIDSLILSKLSDKEKVQLIEQWADNNCDSINQLADSSLSSQIVLLGTNTSHIQLAKYHYYKGYLNYIKENDVEAIKSFLTAIDFIKQIETGKFLEYRLHLRVASSYARLEHFLRTNKLYDKAFEHYHIADDILKTLDDHYEDKCDLYTLMAHAYHGMNQFDLSDAYYLKTFEVAKQANDSKRTIRALINRGNLYFRSNKEQRAIEITKDALRQANEANYAKGKAYCYLNLSMIHNQIKELNAAMDNANKAHLVAKENHIEYIAYRAQQEKALISLKNGNEQKALFHLDSCMHNHVKTNRFYNLTTLRNLSNTHFSIGNYKKGYEYLKRYIQLSDSIKRIDYQRNIKLAESLHQHEATIYENQLLDKENKLQDAELTKSRVIILFVLTLLVLLCLLILYQVKIKNKYKLQALRINEQNEVISLKNDKITLQNKRLSEYKTNLEKRVENRTRELKDALEMAQESNKLKNAFLENISHEIRTPMNAISGFTELLNHQDEKERAKSVELVLSNTNELLVTIEKFLEIAKVSTAEDILDISGYNSTDFNNQVGTYFENYTQTNKLSNNNSFELELCSFKGLLHTDIDKLLRTLAYLIDNAIKFTQNGLVHVKSTDKDHYIEFTVKDTGVGIPANKLQFIFDTFQKINPPSMLTRGTGLGLAIVDQLLKRLKGRICIDSEIGKGTIFTIVIFKEFDIKK